MKVLFINNDGGGFADYVETAEGTTVKAFFEKHMQGQTSTNHLIRVNRQHVHSGYVLQDGDRVSVTPTKIEGALR